MKTGKLIYVIMIISMLFLYACGGGGSTDDGGTPNPETTYNLSGTLTISDGRALEGATITLSGASSDTVTSNPSGFYSFTGLKNGTYTVTPSLADYTFTPISLDVTIYEANATSISFTTTSSGEASGLTRDQAQNALYVVYGGIGYNDREITVDDELLYRMMVENLTSIGSELILTTISDDPSYVTKLLNLLLSPSVTFTSTTTGYTSTITINKKPLQSGYYPFDATLSVAFNGNGYPYGASIIYGTSQASNLTANFTGNFNYTTKDGLTLIIRTVKVIAGNGLEVIEGGVTTSYDNWELAYDINYGTDDPLWKAGDPIIPVNLGLLPSTMLLSNTSYADFRDYTVVGSFTVNDKKFSFVNGFRYKQEQWDYNNVSKTIMSANGKVGVPGLDGYVVVSSVLNAQDPVTNFTIINHVFENGDWSNDWVSGKLVFKGTDSETQAEFDNGSVKFTCGSDSWAVDNWRTALKPF